MEKTIQTHDENLVQKENFPSLKECVASIKNYCTDVYRTTETAELNCCKLFTASIAFMAHLQKDRIIYEKASEGKHNSSPIPDATPAISIFMEDVRLFRIFFYMLTSKLPNNESPPNFPLIGLNTKKEKANRKRASSNEIICESPKKKIAKILVSPHQIGNSEFVKVSTSAAASTVNIHIPSTSNQSFEKSFININEQFNFPVVAAVMFQLAIQHLNHWPVILVEAFAEDCFGKRLWVDDERCRIFTSNLELVLDRYVSLNEVENKVGDSEKFLNNFKHFLESNERDDVSAHINNFQPPSCKFSLTGIQTQYQSASSRNDKESDNSDSGDEDCTLEIISGTALKQVESVDVNFDSFSSSGEEEIEEESVVTESSEKRRLPPTIPLEARTVASLATSVASNTVGTTNNQGWWYQEELKFSLIRNRFFGSSLVLAHHNIENTLSIRLRSKAKQNSKLLSTLPSFMTVPSIRALTAKYLDTWLQSPALSGLARNLFLSIVSAVKNTDPPLIEDIKTIDSILLMKLKANQFSAHVENIISIVKNIPTKTVARHVIFHLLRSELQNDQKEDESPRMFIAVHCSLPTILAFDALAYSLLDFLCDCKRKNCKVLREKTSSLLFRISISLKRQEYNGDYDGYLLIKSLIACYKTENHEILDLEDIARIIFECMTLMVPIDTNQQQMIRGELTESSTSIHKEMTLLTPKLLAIRKMILHWCLNTYAKGIIKNKSKSSSQPKTKKRDSKSIYLVGAGTPDYSSSLDGKSSSWKISDDRLMKTLRCLLFLAKSDSEELLTFLMPSCSTQVISSGQLCHDLQRRVRICSEYGVNIDNETLWIILKSTMSVECAIDSSTTLSLIEQLMYHCRNGQTAEILIDDSKILWEMYKLVEYFPVATSEQKLSKSNDCSDVGEGDDSCKENNTKERITRENIPRLAYPSLWWRVTVLCLVICGKAPRLVGADMWFKNPTLRALVKMIVTRKYIFPTADCNEKESELMKKSATILKDQESQIAKVLFLPQSALLLKNKKHGKMPLPVKSGHRVSTRQKEKQNKVLVIQQEKEYLKFLKEEQKIKKNLKAAQKSIMIWDPKAAARKPPKESLSVLLSINSLFQLAEGFKLCKEPDFLLQTIGSTSRDGIERAYDWLIPVISYYPNIIKRLPSSASCFLLLRAYGEGNENMQLLKLSSPLLRHVTQSLVGKFGKDDALLAIDLLFFDISDKNPDRRSCARRVLQQALGKQNCCSGKQNFDIDWEKFSWLYCLLYLKNARLLILRAIPHLSRALFYEKGDVLRSFVFALLKYEISFTEMQSKYPLDSLICDLLSARPHACSDTMDMFSDLRDVFINLVCKSFRAFILKTRDLNETEKTLDVKINILSSSGSNNIEVFIPLSLLQSSILLISNWKDSNNNEGKYEIEQMHNKQESASKCLMYLVKTLIVTSKGHINSNNEINVSGAASATYIHNGKQAVSVEQWVMLTKCRSDFIARHSVLSTPVIFLPRLLLCCGLPRTSFLSVIKRLGAFGITKNRHKCFSKLLSASATSEWGVGHVKSSLIKRKLLGRISAYISRNSEPPWVENSSFVRWLVEECSDYNVQIKKSKTKKAGRLYLSSRNGNLIADNLKSIDALESSLLEIMQPQIDEESSIDIEIKQSGSPIESISNKLPKALVFDTSETSNDINCESVRKLCKEHLFEKLEYELEHTHTFFLSRSSRLCNNYSNISNQRNPMALLSVELLQIFIASKQRPILLRRILFKWVPRFTQIFNDISCWNLLFKQPDISDFELRETLELLVTRCLEIWDIKSIVACQLWILSVVKSREIEIETFSLSLFLTFLVYKSGQISPHCVCPIDSLQPESYFAINTQENTRAAVFLALKCAKHWSSPTTLFKNDDILPDWFILILSIGKCGKKYLDLIAKMLLDSLEHPSGSWESLLIPGTLLRLYAAFPTMSLANPKTRKTLVNATMDLASEWFEWKNPLDEQLDDALKILAINPIQKQSQLISDFCKRHPLIAVRRLVFIHDILKRDAAISQHEVEKRNRTHLGINDVVAVAESEHGILKVTVIHWGYHFNEALWSSVLSILSSFPEEVIFTCGKEMGLLQLLNLFISLILVQEEARNGGINATTRVRMKLFKLVSDFMSSNQQFCITWTKSKLKDFQERGTIKEILEKECNFTINEDSVTMDRQEPGY